MTVRARRNGPGQRVTALAVAVALAGCRNAAPAPVSDEPALFAGVPDAHRVWQGIRLSWTAAVSPAGRFLAAHAVREAGDQIEVLDLEAGTSRLQADAPVLVLTPQVFYTAAHRRVMGMELPSRVLAVSHMDELWLEDGPVESDGGRR